MRSAPVLPERYALREKDGVHYLQCDEAPRLRAIVDPEMSVSRAEAAALGERVILLDGAGSFGPLIDNEQRLYNLDHHAGCERLFTLATCEQALLLVESGLALSEGDWTLYANDPDLDTVLALWCLLNHRRLRELSTDARDLLLPLLRLEGAIDANGPDLARVCGLPTGVIEETREHIDQLMARERELKREGPQTGRGPNAYTREMLRAVDALVFSGEDFGDYTQVEEIYGHVEVADRKVAVACRDRSGIYTVEQQLKSRWGDQLAVIALENQPGRYTLRRVSSVSGPQLERAYALLNRVDPAVDGRPPGKRWGGSQDIGGSPRPVGTQLSAEEVLEVLARAYRPSTPWSRTQQTLGAFVVGLAFLVPMLVGSTLLASAAPIALSRGSMVAWNATLASLLALAVALPALRAVSNRRPWVFGWRVPASGGFGLAPVALLGGVPLGVWGAAWLGTGAIPASAVLAAGMLSLFAIEVWFRGLVHGLLVLDHPVQVPGGPWFVSRATFVSATTYAIGLAALVAPIPGLAQQPLFATGPVTLPFALVVTVAFGIGLALGVIRERSLSLLPGFAIQAVGLLATAGVAFTLA